MNQKGGAKIILLKFLTMVPKLDYNDEDNNNILHHLVEEGDINMVFNFLKMAIQKNNLKEIINEYNQEGKTPLHIAVSNNSQDIAELLIQFGASKDIVDDKGQKVVWVPEQKGGAKKKKIYGKRYI